MDASIIITQYNQAKILELTLISLACQTTTSRFELIVCDDGGNDITPKLVAKFAKQNPNIDTHYLWQQDKGFRAGQARNMGIRQAVGDILILLDGDMIPTQDFVEKHIAHHKDHKDVLLTGGRLVIDDSKIVGKQFESPEKLYKLLKTKSFLNKEELDYRTNWYKSSKPWMAVFSCNLSVPRNKFTRYSELFVGWGIEDWDFSLRLYKAGYKIRFENSITAFHVDYKPVISNSFRNNKHTELVSFARNVLLLIDQYPEEDLSICAMALQCYKLKNNKWHWDGIDSKYYSKRESIEVLRVWLRNNKIYSHSEEFFVEPHYLASIIVNCRKSTKALEKVLSRYKPIKKNSYEAIVVCDDCSTSVVQSIKILLNNSSISSKLICLYGNTNIPDRSKSSGEKQSLGDANILVDDK